MLFLIIDFSKSSLCQKIANEKTIMLLMDSIVLQQKSMVCSNQCKYYQTLKPSKLLEHFNNVHGSKGAAHISKKDSIQYQWYYHKNQRCRNSKPLIRSVILVH